MELQYLVESEKKAEQCLALEREQEIYCEKENLDEEHFIVTFRSKSNDRRAACRLSDLNAAVTDMISPTVLVNGSAAYFNKILYPLVNDFERKLRKLLYIASVNRPAKEDVISELETKDFGKIFNDLFHDRNYSSKVRAFVNEGKKKNGSEEKTWEEYASELTAFLESIKENSFWDSNLSDYAPTLRKHFLEIKLRRNDVMHAHNIDRKTFSAAESLFKTVNRELVQAIDNISHSKNIPETFNQSLANIIFLEDSASETISAEIIA